MKDSYERLKTGHADEESRYAYADSVANAFLTAQIDALKKDRNLTQEQVAELVGTKQPAISRWQNSGYSSCKLETLRKFARAFGVRMWVSFEEFGSLPADIGSFTRERLTPRRFEDDPAFKETDHNQSRAAASVGLQALATGKVASGGGEIGTVPGDAASEHTLQRVIGLFWAESVQLSFTSFSVAAQPTPEDVEDISKHPKFQQNTKITTNMQITATRFDIPQAEWRIEDAG